MSSKLSCSFNLRTMVVETSNVILRFAPHITIQMVWPLEKSLSLFFIYTYNCIFDISDIWKTIDNSEADSWRYVSNIHWRPSFCLKLTKINKHSVQWPGQDQKSCGFSWSPGKSTYWEWKPTTYGLKISWNSSEEKESIRIREEIRCRDKR
jgi:hypothetical protein